jgi:hypothetical protein
LERYALMQFAISSLFAFAWISSFSIPIFLSNF